MGSKWMKSNRDFLNPNHLIIIEMGSYSASYNSILNEKENAQDIISSWLSVIIATN